MPKDQFSLNENDYTNNKIKINNNYLGFLSLFNWYELKTLVFLFPRQQISRYNKFERKISSLRIFFFEILYKKLLLMLSIWNGYACKLWHCCTQIPVYDRRTVKHD